MPEKSPPVGLDSPGKGPAARRGLLALIALCLAMTGLFAQTGRDPEVLQQQLVFRFSPARVPLLNSWLTMLRTAGSLKEEEKLKRINDFINQNIVFDNDIDIWQQSDYWATPLETIGQGRGDCEDFAIFKYVSLRVAGVASNKLRLVYAKARLDSPSGPVQQAHMVLAYYATPDRAPLILDNLDGAIRPASQRTDLQPVFSFNSEGIFAGVSGKDRAASGSIRRLSRWEDAWRRILAEGYE